MTAAALALGPVMIDVAGHTLSEAERRRLVHPLVGGVILFARNFESPTQLALLCAEIHALRDPPLLIAVDQEGGRVQRFRDGFTRLPAMACLGRAYDADPAVALEAAAACGRVLATELRRCGVDLSFAPVLDLDFGASSVIGDRALHADPAAVSALAGALLGGLASAGMRGVGKHFPGHGFVSADSHLAVPVDLREPAEILGHDARPYRDLVGHLGAVMPAHVIYERCDPSPAGFSRYWLRQVLRGEFGFAGVIFSDDLSMEGAAVAGGILQRAEAARQAGCDMVLVCNEPDRADELLAGWDAAAEPAAAARIAALVPRTAVPLDDAALAASREAVLRVPALAPRGEGCGG